MDTVEYQACDSANVDATTGVCSQPVWVQQQSPFPSLSMTDGGLVAFAIIGCWAMGYLARALRLAD